MNKTFQDDVKTKFEKHLKRASEIVASWPPWKRDVLGKHPESNPFDGLFETVARIRDTQTTNFCNLIDELAQAKNVGGTNFNDARDMIVQLIEFHTEIKTLDYVLAEIEYACGEAKS